MGIEVRRRHAILEGDSRSEPLGAGPPLMIASCATMCLTRDDVGERGTGDEHDLREGVQPSALYLPVDMTCPKEIAAPQLLAGEATRCCSMYKSALSGILSERRKNATYSASASISLM